MKKTSAARIRAPITPLPSAEVMAWWYRGYAKEQSVEDRASYAQAEDKARVRRVGLWKDARPLPPWEWRMRAKPAVAGQVIRNVRRPLSDSV